LLKFAISPHWKLLQHASLFAYYYWDLEEQNYRPVWAVPADIFSIAAAGYFYLIKFFSPDCNFSNCALWGRKNDFEKVTACCLLTLAIFFGYTLLILAFTIFSFGQILLIFYV
jgi:hypothetical protein